MANQYSKIPNDYRINGAICHVTAKNGTFIIDTEDYELVSQYHWTIDKSHGYVVTTIDGKKTYLHRLLVKPHKSMLCDHINRNKLDNRRINLREVGFTENNINCGSKGKSGHKFINIKRGKYYVKGWGSFEDIEDAILARNILWVYNQLIRE